MGMDVSRESNQSRDERRTVLTPMQELQSNRNLGITSDRNFLSENHEDDGTVRHKSFFSFFLVKMEPGKSRFLWIL